MNEKIPEENKLPLACELNLLKADERNICTRIRCSSECQIKSNGQRESLKTKEVVVLSFALYESLSSIMIMTVVESLFAIVVVGQ